MLFAYETQRLLLNIIKPDQADQVLDFYLRDKELFEQFEPDRPNNFYTRKFQQQTLLYEYNMAVKGAVFRFYIFEKEYPGKIIGTISIHNISRGYSSSCEIGYKFSSEVHRRGYATEALTAVSQLIFNELGIHRIMAWALPENRASIRLLQRVGFTYEGVSREYLLLHGQWRDHAQFSLLASDQSSANWHIQ